MSDFPLKRTFAMNATDYQMYVLKDRMDDAEQEAREAAKEAADWKEKCEKLEETNNELQADLLHCMEEHAKDEILAQECIHKMQLEISHLADKIQQLTFALGKSRESTDSLENAMAKDQEKRRKTRKYLQLNDVKK